jgi:hypothetical protein
MHSVGSDGYATALPGLKCFKENHKKNNKKKLFYFF